MEIKKLLTHSLAVTGIAALTIGLTLSGCGNGGGGKGGKTQNVSQADDIIPSRMYPLYLLGKMYSAIGDRERAAFYARRVVGMTPKVSSPATDDMQREMRELIENGVVVPIGDAEQQVEEED
jgi:hypothetical protein